ncbi:MAG: fumarylacetoacetate hydrolase family protein [Pseudomonadota bacterium]
MRLITFTHEGSTRIGSIDGEQIVDLNAADSELPTDMVSLLQGGDAMLDRARDAVTGAGAFIPLSEVHLESPILNPRKILAVGLNYMDHFNEVPEEIKQRAGFKIPETPILFNKQVTSVAGPYDPIALPPESVELDYEAELAVVIGKTCRRVSKEDVPKVIAGYMVSNDVSIRDWQRAAPTMMMGKGWDSHCPMGPALVTADEIDDPEKLAVKLTVDGDVRQDFNTGDMLFDIATQISYMSTAFTLEPGDILLTGTSAGVGFFWPGGGLLKAGQKVRIDIESLGHIENVVEADAGASFIR